MRRLIVFLIVLCVSLVTVAQTISDFSSREYDILFHEAMLQRQQRHHDAAFDLLMCCKELCPEASETYYFLAQYYSGMKQNDQALAAFEKAAELEPANATYMETLSDAYIMQKRYGDAVLVVKKLYEADKSREELLETLYHLYTGQEMYEEAIDVLDKLEQNNGKTERIALAKSRLYLQLGESDKSALEMKELMEQHPNDLNYKTLYANAMMINGQRDEAVKLLYQVLDEEPDNIRAQVALKGYYSSEEDSSAVMDMTRRILLNPRATTEDKVYQMRSLIALNEESDGDSTQILNLFREMLNQPTPDPDIAELTAAYMDLKKMPRDSIAQALELVLRLAPERTTPRLQLVQYAWENDDNDSIISLCQAARQYNPEEMAFYYYQGMAYYRQDDTDHALEAFQNGISVINEDSSPEIVSDFYAVMGDLLFLKDRKREAFEAYDSCLQWKPDNIGCLNNYAYYLSLDGENLEQAELMSYKTIKAQPTNSTYLDTYAWILFMEGRYAEARIYIDQALQNDSAVGAVVTEHAGDIYALSGDMEGAITLWRQALEMDSQNKLLVRKLKKKKYFKK
ncbi:MAG: tetratricopeptide repeat protein [Prevotella sp.]|nr:tetratricopeptide repeat protein [Prevotella sp.]